MDKTVTSLRVGMTVQHDDGAVGVIDEVYLSRDGGLIHTPELGWVKAWSVHPC